MAALITSELYSTFVNAFSYTIAVQTVDSAVNTTQGDLLMIAGTIAVLVELVGVVEAGLATVTAQTAARNPVAHRVVSGPIEMFRYTLVLSRRIAVHFMSTILGKWAMSGTAGQGLDVATTLPQVLLCIALMWLLGKASGLA